MYNPKRRGGESLRGRFAGTRTRRSQTPYARARGLGFGALAMVGTLSLIVLMRRRAKRNGSSTEQVNENLIHHEDVVHSERAEVSAEGHREYFRKIIEETSKRSRSSGQNSVARGRPTWEQEREVRMERDDERAGQREAAREGHIRDEEELRVQRSEEELRTGTREREAGEVRVRKQVHTEREQVRVPKRREEVSVERVPVDEEGTGAEIGEDEVSVPVVEEEVVVEKRPVVKEEIRVRKDVVQDEQVVEEDVRKEEVDVEDRTERLEGRAEGRRGVEGETERTTAGSERRADNPGREETGKEEGFIEKAKRKLEGQ